MRALTRRGIGAALGAALILTAAAVPAGQETAPEFRLEDVRGDVHVLADALAEGPVILDFWATWCKPCRKALPALQALADRHEGRVTVWTVSIDDPRSRTKIGATLRSLGVTLPALLDEDKEVAELYRVTAVPTTFLIAPDGEVVASHRGYRDGDTERLEAELTDLLREVASE